MGLHAFLGPYPLQSQQILPQQIWLPQPIWLLVVSQLNNRHCPLLLALFRSGFVCVIKYQLQKSGKLCKIAQDAVPGPHAAIPMVDKVPAMKEDHMITAMCDRALQPCMRGRSWDCKRAPERACGQGGGGARLAPPPSLAGSGRGVERPRPLPAG